MRISGVSDSIIIPCTEALVEVETRVRLNCEASLFMKTKCLPLTMLSSQDFLATSTRIHSGSQPGVRITLSVQITSCLVTEMRPLDAGMFISSYT